MELKSSLGGEYLTHLNFTVSLDTCRLGMVFNPPTNRSIGIAIRPRQGLIRPVLNFYIPEPLMIKAGFHIGDGVIAAIEDRASVIKISKDPNGYSLFAAANQPDCVDYEEAIIGSQYPARFNAPMTLEVTERFIFEDKCTTFVDAMEIRKNKYIIAPLDDLPIWPVKKKRK